LCGGGRRWGLAESGCRGVVQWWGEGLVGERAAAYEAIEVSSRRFEIHVYGPSARSWKFPVSKMKHYLTWWGNSMQSRNTLRALGMLPDRPTDHEKAVRESPRACWAERRTSAPTLRSCSMGQPGKSPVASLKALYGYASNTPGARNGHYTDPMLEGPSRNPAWHVEAAAQNSIRARCPSGHVPAAPSTSASAPPAARLGRR